MAIFGSTGVGKTTFLRNIVGRRISPEAMDFSSLIRMATSPNDRSRSSRRPQ